MSPSVIMSLLDFISSSVMVSASMTLSDQKMSVQIFSLKSSVNVVLGFVVVSMLDGLNLRWIVCTF